MYLPRHGEGATGEGWEREREGKWPHELWARQKRTARCRASRSRPNAAGCPASTWSRSSRRTRPSARRAAPASIPATCTPRRAGCLRTTSSSCTTCAGGSSLSAPSRSRARRVPGRTPAAGAGAAAGGRPASKRPRQAISVWARGRRLAKVHHDRLVDLLPQVRPEDLDQRDLERGDLPVHEDPRQIELHLKADVHVRAVDRR